MTALLLCPESMERDGPNPELAGVLGGVVDDPERQIDAIVGLANVARALLMMLEARPEGR